MEFEIEVTDFIEEESTAICLLEVSGFFVGGACKGAAFVAKEFTFEEFSGDSAAINGNEGLVIPVGELVYGFSNQFFTGTTFTEDQDRDIGRGDFMDLLDNILDSGAFSNQRTFLEGIF